MLDGEFFSWPIHLRIKVKSDLSECFSCSHGFSDSIFTSLPLLKKRESPDERLTSRPKMVIVTFCLFSPLFCKISLIKVDFSVSKVLKNSQRYAQCSWAGNRYL